MHEFESGFFYKEPAWHKHGTTVYEMLSTEEAVAKAIPNGWTALERPAEVNVCDVPGGQQYIEVPNRKVIYRSDTKSVLGIVSTDYKVLQYQKAFNFFDGFLQQGDVHLESAGVLCEGKKFWILARIKDVTKEVIPGDAVEAYLLLATGHDGETAVWVVFTPIRVVCANTLGAALANAESGRSPNVSIRHTADMDEAIAMVKDTVDLSKKTFDISIEAYQELAKKKLPVDGIAEYVSEVLKPVEFREYKDKQAAYSKRSHSANVFLGNEAPEFTLKALPAIEQLLETGAGVDIPGVQGTYWGAYNALTEWIDHERGTEEGRLNSSWFISGREIRQRALKLALAA